MFVKVAEKATNALLCAKKNKEEKHVNNMLMDYAVLIGRIKDKYGTQGHFAKEMGMSRSGLSAKLNNHRDFTTEEIVKACELLEIPAAAIPLLFFKPKVA